MVYVANPAERMRLLGLSLVLILGSKFGSHGGIEHAYGYRVAHAREGSRHRASVAVENETVSY